MADFMLRQVPPEILRRAKAKAGGPGPLAALLRLWLARYVEEAPSAPQPTNAPDESAEDV